ncbi:MAG: 16S rRNA processing protein RimM, partial [Lachnospiraceae bacterium]|nr:16S rRNA processing protein RimM [Lachnospiraceae bacterium]
PYKGKNIYVDREHAVDLDEDEYFVADLLGLKVVTDEGEEFGELTDVLFTKANDVYTITRPDGKEVLIPAIEECILDIDLDEEVMTIHIMPGLLD